MTDQVPDNKMFSAWKVIIPVIIGLAVVVLMFIHDAREENMVEVLKSIRIDNRVLVGMLLALLAVVARDFGLTWRFRILTGGELGWRSSLNVCMLCEFTSCITPSAVGGSALGMFFLSSKGIEFGRATTLMLTTIFLDELFFTLTCPVIVLLSQSSQLFASGDHAFSEGMEWSFWIIYSLLALYTLLLFAGIIWKPLWIQKMIHRLFQFRWLRKWADKADELGANMVATSAELRNRSLSFWSKAFAATATSWVGRFAVVNAIFFAFITSADIRQWLIFAREFVIWLILMVSPTPGGSGLSEWIFSAYYGDIVNVAGMALLLAIIWRILTYYLYLFTGAMIVPGWIKNTYKNINHK